MAFISGLNRWSACLGSALAGFGLFAIAFESAGAEVDLKSLPPPANRPIDFATDIRPLLQTACLKCHGPETHKSGFQLTTRLRALKGGEKGVDIFPGDSAQSPLIHYVAGLVDDMEMPPAGKGAPLTVYQVALLRA